MEQVRIFTEYSGHFSYDQCLRRKYASRGDMCPRVRGFLKSRYNMRYAPGACAPARADAYSEGIIRTARAGHAFLRARMPTFRRNMHRTERACAPARADAYGVGIIRTARAGHAFLRARMPTFRRNMPRTEWECAPECAAPHRLGFICTARGACAPACADSSVYG